MFLKDHRLKIRRAQPGDEISIAKVHIQSWQEAYRNLLPDDFLNGLPMTYEKRVLNWKAAINHAERWVFVAEFDGEIVGFASFQPARDADRAEFGELSAIYFLEAYKGKGGGFSLLSAGFNFLKDKNYKKAYCWVLENNPTIKFYERSGASFSRKIKTDEIGGLKVNELEYQWQDLNIGEYDWQPLSVNEISLAMKSFEKPWWIAGGWAIDLFLERQTREHEDIDIVILREDQMYLQEYFSEWELWAADPPGTLVPWQKEKYLKKGIQDIWMRKDSKSPWQVQIMLIDQENGEWLFKRDEEIRRNLETFGIKTKDGILSISPEIQLLYKSKGLREKDQMDFQNASSRLSADQRSWLFKNLKKIYGDSHPWINELA